MECNSRHQCLIYEGAPSRHLQAVASILRNKLERGYRCLYLNSPPMVAGMRSYLAAAGTDVLREVAEGRLVLSSEQQHLVNDRFDIDRMVETLEEAVSQALQDGYAGLWASGDMSWEFGPDRDFTKLVSYEWRLEELFQQQPSLCGICQYHSGSLPEEAMRLGLMMHPSVFINEMLSFMNPYYIRPEMLAQHPKLSPLLGRLGTR